MDEKYVVMRFEGARAYMLRDRKGRVLVYKQVTVRHKYDVVEDELGLANAVDGKWYAVNAGLCVDTFGEKCVY